MFPNFSLDENIGNLVSMELAELSRPLAPHLGVSLYQQLALGSSGRKATLERQELYSNDVIVASWKQD